MWSTPSSTDFSTATAQSLPPTSERRRSGELRPEEEAQLALPSVPDEQQIGYLRRQTEEGGNRGRSHRDADQVQ